MRLLESKWLHGKSLEASCRGCLKFSTLCQYPSIFLDQTIVHILLCAFLDIRGLKIRGNYPKYIMIVGSLQHFSIFHFGCGEGKISFTNLRGQKSFSLPFSANAWFVTRTVTSVVDGLGEFMGDFVVTCEFVSSRLSAGWVRPPEARQERDVGEWAASNTASRRQGQYSQVRKLTRTQFCSHGIAGKARQ